MELLYHSQALLGSTRNQRGNQGSLKPSEVIWPNQHLYFRFLASKAVREYISPVVMCYSNYRKLRQYPSSLLGRRSQLKIRNGYLAIRVSIWSLMLLGKARGQHVTCASELLDLGRGSWGVYTFTPVSH